MSAADIQKEKKDERKQLKLAKELARLNEEDSTLTCIGTMFKVAEEEYEHVIEISLKDIKNKSDNSTGHYEAKIDILHHRIEHEHAKNLDVAHRNLKRQIEVGKSRGLLNEDETERLTGELCMHELEILVDKRLLIEEELVKAKELVEEHHKMLEIAKSAQKDEIKEKTKDFADKFFSHLEALVIKEEQYKEIIQDAKAHGSKYWEAILKKISESEVDKSEIN